MTVFTDNIIFLSSGVQRLSHSGDTISISRNLTIASPSVFTVGVAINFSSTNTSPNLIQTIQPSDLATNILAVRAQDAYAGAATNVLGGNLTLSSGLGTTTGNSGSVLIQTGGTTRLSISPTNVAILAIRSAPYLKTDASGNIGVGTSLAVSNLTGGTDGYILITNGSTPTWTKFTGDVTNSDTGVTTVNSISGSSPIPITPATLQFTAATTAPTITQAAAASNVTTVTGTNGVPMSITAQAGQADGYTLGVTNTGGTGGVFTLSAGAGGAASAGTTNNGGAGGNLVLTSGAGGVGTQTTGLAGLVKIQAGTTNMVQYDGYGEILTSTSQSVAAGGTITLTQAQQGATYLALTGTMPNNTNIQYTATVATNTVRHYKVDISAVVFSTHTLTFQTGTNSTTVALTALTTNQNVIDLYATTSNIFIANL